MRLLSLFLVLIFSFQNFEMTLAHFLKSSRTCCGRLVCLCQHEKGAMCPMKNVKERVTERSHCTFMEVAAEANEQAVIPPRPLTGFTKAPCSSDAPSTLLPGHSKEFVLGQSEEIYEEQICPEFLFEFLKQELFPYPQKIDPPPRLLVSL